MALSSPLRAVLTAHLQATWNRSWRESSLNHAWVVFLVGMAAALFGLLPLGVGCVVMGYLSGSVILTSSSVPLALGATLTLVPALVGLVEGILSSGHTLPWEAFRMFPLRLRTLMAAEVLAGAASLGFIACGAASLAFFIGLCAGAPVFTPWAVLWWVSGGMIHLLASQCASILGASLARHLRFVLFVSFLVVSIGPTLLSRGSWHPRKDANLADPPQSVQEIRARARAWTTEASRLAAYLPMTQSVAGAIDIQRGRYLPGLMSQAYAWGCLALCVFAAQRLLAWEARNASPRETSSKSGKAERLWSFSHPRLGVGRLQAICILKSHVGRLTFIMPIFPVVMLAAPLRPLANSPMALPLAVTYVLLTTGSIGYNQFGLDRHGIKALFLLPLTGQDLLVGKALGTGLHAALVAGLTLVLTAPCTSLRPVPVLSALLFGASLMALNMAAGQWTSVWQPRALPWDAFNKTNLPFATAMVNLGVNGFAMALLVGIYTLLTWVAPILVLPVLFLLALALWLLYAKRCLPLLGAYLDRHRERVMAALEG